MNTGGTPVRTVDTTPTRAETAPVDQNGRIVVVVPDATEPALLAGRIHQVAQARGQSVLLLGIASETVPEDELRRKLILLSAFLANTQTPSEIRVVGRRELLPELQALLDSNDLLACCVDEDESSPAIVRLDALSTRFARPVYAFVDTGRTRAPRISLLARLAPWLGSAAIILGFLWLQIWLSSPDHAAYSGWLLASLPAEIGLLWALNAVSG